MEGTAQRETAMSREIASLEKACVALGVTWEGIEQRIEKACRPAEPTPENINAKLTQNQMLNSPLSDSVRVMAKRLTEINRRMDDYLNRLEL